MKWKGERRERGPVRHNKYIDLEDGGGASRTSVCVESTQGSRDMWTQRTQAQTTVLVTSNPQYPAGRTRIDTSPPEEPACRRRPNRNRKRKKEEGRRCSGDQVNILSLLTA